MVAAFSPVTQSPKRLAIQMREPARSDGIGSVEPWPGPVSTRTGTPMENIRLSHRAARGVGHPRNAAIRGDESEVVGPVVGSG